jgi:hypothetical protein
LKKNAASITNNTVDSGTNWDEIEKRDNMLESLLILLNSAAKLGFGPNPFVFSSDYSARPQQQQQQQQRPVTSEFPGKKFSKDLNDLNETKQSFTFTPHYQLVSLSLTTLGYNLSLVSFLYFSL